jgi:hypothetical protein
MPGADILVAWVDDDTGEVNVQDRWAHGKAAPTLDSCSSWLVDDGFQNDTHTVIAATRRRITGDASDRPIPSGSVKVIWAHNMDGTDGFGYHGNMRHSTSVEFFRDSTLDELTSIDPEWQYVDLRMNNYTVPTRETVYACQSFNLTQTTDKHIVRIEPLLDPATASMVHHFLLHQCEPPGEWDRFQVPNTCVSPIAPTNTGCTSPIFGWGVGGGPLYLPLEAGYRLRSSSDPNAGMRYFILEVHYNSPVPSLPTMRTDSSGVRVYYTDNLRPNDAGMMVLGDPFVSTAPLMPATMTHIQASCSSECTSAWPHEINIFADFLHMHALGSRMWSTLHRGDSQLGYLNRIEYYDYNFQELGPLVPQVKVKPGDRIETHCMFNTYSVSGQTKFGSASDEEMCMEFIAYYPILKDPATDTPWAVCGYGDAARFLPGRTNVTVCGALNVDTLYARLLAIPYNLRLDLPGGENSAFGTANDALGSCPDPITGRMISPQVTPVQPLGVDVVVVIWACVLGIFVGLVAILGFIHQLRRSATANKPARIEEAK